MSSKLFAQQLKEARRDALVGHYIANHDFGAYAGRINNANDLYEYLLLDTQISDSIITTHLSEGINSLQLAIHRAMEGYDGDLATTAQPWFAEDAFLANWDHYNKRYSTWAGKEKMRFYAGNYIDPTLRTNKTQLFKNLENRLNQGKLTTETVQDTLTTFIADCDAYTGMEHLYAGLGNAQKTRLYFTGQMNQQYFWREVWLNKSADEVDCKPVFWGEWQPLPANIKDPINGVVVVSYGSHGAQCRWITQEKDQNNNNVGVQHTWGMTRDSRWQQQRDSFNTLSFAESPYWTITPTEEDQFYVKEEYGGQCHIRWDSFRMELTISQVQPIESFIVTKIHVFQDPADTPILIVQKEGTGTVHIPLKEDAKGHLFILGWHSDPKERPIYVDYTTPYWGSFSTDGDNIWLMKKDDRRLFTVTAPLVSGALGNWLADGISALLQYDNQASVAANGAWHYGGSTSNKGDAFSGPYSQYLWEIFFHIPFLVATRFTTEQRFEEAYTWYKYIFNSAGYRDADGKPLLDDAGSPRYWNCYALQQDTGWDSELLPSSDPDAIAMADPMHYKLAIFLHTLDLLITRGDALYRQLERDTLTEAKMYYVQARQLLGPRPDIRLTNSWSNPTLSAEAGNIGTPLTEGAPVTFAQWLRAGDTHDMGDGDFLPPYNDALLAYWDKLELRLYNLRHNLSLSGQPLSLPLYATPADPAELHRQQSGGNGPQSEVAPGSRAVTGWRYPLLSEFARSAVSQLMQFGNSLQNVLERQDNERMTLLLQTQQVSVLDQQQEVAQKNLNSLTAALAALRVSHETATLHKTHYDNLLNGGLSAGEVAALTLRSTSMGSNLLSISTAIAGGALSAVPNTFGLANGGGDFGAPLHAATQVTQTLAHTLDQAATISDITAGYQRRSEEWVLQRDSAEKEQSQLTAQIDSLQQQIIMAQKQMALNELEAANAQEQYELQVSRFTGQALYNWLAGRLSALYYQQYDATLPVCLQARSALEQELGKGLTDSLFRTPVWDDLWQGLLAGEGLNVELQKLSNIWLENSAKGLEATRTVSLAAQREESSGSLRVIIGQILAGQTDIPAHGVTLALNGDGMFTAELNLAELGLDTSYNMSSLVKSRFVKNISVTLPTLLGPYQDIEATLQLGDEVATLSHGMNDSGRFVTNFDGSQFLPFEGADPTAGTLKLTLFNVKEGDEPAVQYATVENLSDIIFHIHYILRDKT